MPGITGLITRMPRGEAQAQLARMVAALKHEPFYETGTWSDEALGIYVGWVAPRGSFASGMPLVNEAGDMRMIFSGEEYPEPGTPGMLTRKGHTLNCSPASYLVHLSEENTEFLRGLNGLFHGLLIDHRTGKATLFNDRYGMHRLFYYEGKDTFYFGAEAKAILAARPDLRRADPRGVGEMASFSCVLEDRTIFQDIFALPAGSAWEFRGGRLDAKRQYFQASEWEQQTPLPENEFYEQLREGFSRNLPRYFAGQEKIGIALTGGLDTRLLLAWHKPRPGEMPCYTFGSKFRENHDVRVARQVADALGQSHQVLAIGDDFLKQFPKYAERSIYLTEGTVDVYRTSDLYVSERARQIAPVKVVGTYGSEIVCHAVMFKPQRQSHSLYQGDLQKQIELAGETYKQVQKVHPVTWAAFRQSPWYHHGILALEQTQLTVRSPYLDNEFVRMIYRAPHQMSEDVRWKLIRDGSPQLAAIPTDRGIGGSGAIQKIREFSFKAEYAYDYGMPQWVSRTDHLLSPLKLERLFLGRHKLLHFRVWYRDELSRFVKEMLLDPKTLSRPYAERAGIENIVRGHLDEGRNHTTEIHKMLTLELVHRLFLDAQ